MSNEYIAHCREDGKVQTVAEHCRGTAALAAQFAAAFGAAEQGRTAGLAHDLGKYSAEFQRRIRDPEHTPVVDHSTAGAKVAGGLGLPEIAFAVAGHHAGLPDGGSPLDGPDAATLVGRLQKEISVFDAWQQELQLPPCPPPSCRSRSRFSQSFFTRMLYSCLVDADYLDTEAFLQPEQADLRGSGTTMAALLDKLHQKTDRWLSVAAPAPLNRKRNAILRSCLEHGRSWPRGLYSLTVPTGGGKTVASLAFALEQAAALGMVRVVYVIPYTSIIDQTVEVFRSILGGENVLAHYAGAEYPLRETSALSARDYHCALAAENWDAPVIVTTAVQFFESLYANKSSRCRKIHNLSDSVLVFDEAQTLPLPYLRPCVAAIAELVENYRASAVLCTATQPALGPVFAELGGPAASQIREICPEGPALYRAFRRTTLRELGSCTERALAERLAAQDEVLCVVNRRGVAQVLYAALPEEGRFCLTTLLCPWDRKARLAEIRRRLGAGLPCRVVSTSLIEAGVDVDFPTAYREEAGLDSILQTAGRCNREGTHPASESIVTVFRLQDTPPPAMLAQNIAALQAVRRAHPAQDTPEAVAQYFTLLRGLKGNPALDRKGILPAFEKDWNGVQFPFASIAAQFKLIESPTREVYLPRGPGAALCARLRGGEKNRALFRDLGMYSVAVYPQHFEALYRSGALDETLLRTDDLAVLTDTSLYDAQTGLALEIETGHGWFL